VEAIASIIIALTAIAALGVGWLQLRANEQLSRENYAIGTWSQYLKVGFENPAFCSERLAMREYSLKTVGELVSGESLASEKYLWFLTIVLDTCEAVLTYLPREDWERTIVNQLKFHRSALAQVWDHESEPWRHFYGPRLNAIVTRVLDNA